MSEQSQDKQHFDLWFRKILEPLMLDPNAGIVCAMVAFPLLERYVERKCGDSNGTPFFLNALVGFLDELENQTNAKSFWKIYRHGLLHNVLVQGQGVWLSHQTAVIDIKPEGF